MQARDFEVLEHPADIGFRAFGASLPELYANAAIAMLSIADDPATVEPREQYHLAVESGDRESLMVDWLSEVLYWFDGKRIAFREIGIEVSENGPLPYSRGSVAGITESRPSGSGLWRIEALARGEPRHAERHRARLIVKAVTYHQLKIEERGGRWVAEVYLDI